MILTVTPNPCVDKTYRVKGFTLDRVNRPLLTHTVAGGKGVNVARVYRTLGGRALATGFLGGWNGRIVADALKHENIENYFLTSEGDTRICIAVIDPEAGTQTEINEAGPQFTEKSGHELLQEVERLLSQFTFRYVVLCGSLPPGIPNTFYADIIMKAKQLGVKTALDASGEALKRGAEAGPWLVKPNQFELAGLLDQSAGGAEWAAEAARFLRDRYGIAEVVVTLGAEGALLSDAEGEWAAVPPRVKTVSAVASGDSFLAAFLKTWHTVEPAVQRSEALRMAVGAGAANAEVIGAGFCSREAILQRASETIVTQTA